MIKYPQNFEFSDYVKTVVSFLGVFPPQPDGRQYTCILETVRLRRLSTNIKRKPPDGFA